VNHERGGTHFSHGTKAIRSFMVEVATRSATLHQQFSFVCINNDKPFFLSNIIIHI
jgi:hypothetical protein